MDNVRQTGFAQNMLFKKIWTAIPIFLLLVVAVLLRLPYLNESLWHDEVISASLLWQDTSLLLTNILQEAHPPLHYIFTFFWTKLFGISEIALRAPSFIFGILSIAIAYIFAAKCMGRRVALLTAFLLTVSPVHIWYSREARQYSGAFFFLLLYMLAYYKLGEGKPKRSWYYIYGLSLVGIVFSHYYLIIYPVFIAILSLSYNDVAVIPVIQMPHERKVRRRILMINGIVFYLFICFFIQKMIFGDVPTRWFHLRQFTLTEFFMLFFNWFLAGNSIWVMSPYKQGLSQVLNQSSMIYFQLFFVLLFLYGLISTYKETKRPYGPVIILCLFLLPAFLLILSLAGFKYFYIERSAYMVLPFFYMVLVKGVTGIKNRIASNAVMVAVIAFSLFAMGSFFYKQNAWTVYKPKPDWKGAYRYFLEQKEDPMLVFTTLPEEPFLYYDFRYIRERNKETDPPPPHFLPCSVYKVKNITSGRIRQILKKENLRVFYTFEDTYWPSNAKMLLTAIAKDPAFYLIEKRSLKSLTVFKFGLR